MKVKHTHTHRKVLKIYTSLLVESHLLATTACAVISAQIMHKS